jgi:hypothetical protein
MKTQIINKLRKIEEENNIEILFEKNRLHISVGIDCSIWASGSRIGNPPQSFQLVADTGSDNCIATPARSGMESTKVTEKRKRRELLRWNPW